MSHSNEFVSSLSPSLTARSEGGAAYEVKFLISEAIAGEVESWAGQQLRPDPHGDPERGGSYQVTSLYTDTPEFDVYHRSPKFRRRKYRLRRYGRDDVIHLERKIRRGEQVSKRRVLIPESDAPLLSHPLSLADWPGGWFHQSLLRRNLRPSCQLVYLRKAYFRSDTDGPLRLTLDREIRGQLTSDWCLAPLEAPRLILPGEVVLELKFRDHLPQPFKQLVHDLQLSSTGVSKYRRCLDLCLPRETVTENGVNYA
ncbi:polyphosphate polymerase domain-containing protein [Planctomicrobium sp. SH664]|uniref:polyphosphate polymerase domain-containing protein n=1 Tax=Planctomicrobium sp. SH664 TaxID=3448125 RepID=UPI003F5B4C4B